MATFVPKFDAKILPSAIAVEDIWIRAVKGCVESFRENYLNQTKVKNCIIQFKERDVDTHHIYEFVTSCTYEFNYRNFAAVQVDAVMYGYLLNTDCVYTTHTAFQVWVTGDKDKVALTEQFEVKNSYMVEPILNTFNFNYLHCADKA